jgi:hypothetical protein
MKYTGTVPSKTQLIDNKLYCIVLYGIVPIHYTTTQRDGLCQMYYESLKKWTTFSDTNYKYKKTNVLPHG